jgi:hypothetical protein
MRVMGADAVEPPSPGARVVPAAGRASFWPAVLDDVDERGALRVPGLVLVHRDADGRLRLHRMAVERDGAGARGQRFVLVLASRAVDLDAALELARDNAWERVGADRPGDLGEGGGVFAAELYRRPEPSPRD